MSDLVSEDHILACIDRHFPGGGERVLLGRGDDCAVLDVTGPLCVSTDLFMEDVHFRRAYFTPEDVGWKALAVNLSDLAACGARPVGFTVGLALPGDADMALVDGLCAGMAALATLYAVPLVGGDLSRAERLHVCVTVFGQAETTLLRGVAVPGDVIFMVGRAGLARAGLALLEQYGRDALADWPEACAAHLRPNPRIREGMRLSTLAADAESLRIPDRGRLGLMDLSDGLARDLPRLVGKGRGADITLPMPHPEILRLLESHHNPTLSSPKTIFLVPPSSSSPKTVSLVPPSGNALTSVQRRAGGLGRKTPGGGAPPPPPPPPPPRGGGGGGAPPPPRREASPPPPPPPSPSPSLSPAQSFLFQGGEDYALVGTCAPELASRVMVTVAEAVVLGKVRDGEGVWVDGVRTGGGFDHFSA